MSAQAGCARLSPPRARATTKQPAFYAAQQQKRCAARRARGAGMVCSVLFLCAVWSCASMEQQLQQRTKAAQKRARKRRKRKRGAQRHAAARSMHAAAR